MKRRQLDKRTHFNIRSSFLEQNLIISVSVVRDRMQWLQPSSNIPFSLLLLLFCTNCVITIHTYHDGSIVSNCRKRGRTSEKIERKKEREREKVTKHSSAIAIVSTIHLCNSAILSNTLLGGCG